MSQSPAFRSPLCSLYLGIAVSLLTFIVPRSALAQDTESPRISMAELLSGNRYPLKMKAGNLTSSWKKVQVGFGTDMMLFLRAPIAYYTKGETVQVGFQSFLIAYRRAELPQITAADQRGSEPQPALTPMKMSTDTELSLSLINVATIGVLTHVEPVNPDAELASAQDIEEERQQRQAAQAIQNAKQIALGCLMYVQDYDEIYPDKAASYKQAIIPYVKNDSVFTAPGDPTGTVSFSFNRRLQGRGITDVASPAETIMLYDGSKDQPRYRYQGKAVIAFADGHVKLCTPETVGMLDWGRNLPPLKPPRKVEVPKKHPGKRSTGTKVKRRYGKK